MKNLKKNFNFLLIGLFIGVILGYAWHFSAVKDKLNVYQNCQRIINQKEAQIRNCKLRSELCCGYLEHLIKR